MSDKSETIEAKESQISVMKEGLIQLDETKLKNAELEENLKSAVNTIEVCNLDISSLKEQVEKFEDELRSSGDFGERLIAVQSELAKSNKHKDKLAKDLSEKETQLSQKEAEMSEKLGQYSTKIDEISQESSSRLAEIEQLRVELAKNAEKLADATENAHARRLQIESIQEGLAQMDEVKLENAELENKLNLSIRQIEETQTLVEKLTEERDELSVSVNGLNQTLEEVTGEQGKVEN